MTFYLIFNFFVEKLKAFFKNLQIIFIKSSHPPHLRHDLFPTFAELLLHLFYLQHKHIWRL